MSLNSQTPFRLHTLSRRFTRRGSVTLCLLIGLAIAGSWLLLAPRVQARLDKNASSPSQATVQADATKTQASSKEIPAGVRALYEASRLAVKPSSTNSGQFVAMNPDQRWSTNFDGRGFITTPSASQAKTSWKWGLQLKSYGFAKQQCAVSEVASVKTQDGRVTYNWSEGLEEFYINEARGLEHGFTLQNRPALVEGAPLTFTMSVRGDLKAKAAKDGQSIAFLNANEMVALNYSDLKVTDADGKILSARMETRAAEVLIQVEEKDARYPLTVDPLAANATEVYIKAPAHTVTDEFGHAVAIDGTTMVVGAPLEDTTGADSGAAYVYVASGGVWVLQQVLKAPADALLNIADRFGAAVDVSGDTIVVGAWGEDSSTTGVNSTADNLAVNSGAAYVFVRSGGVWTLQAYLKASNTGAVDGFGQGVAIDGDTIVVTAPWEDGAGQGVNPGIDGNTQVDSGAGYVFTRTGTVWAETAYLKADNAEAFDYFGGSPFLVDVDYTGAVDISGGTIVIGAPLEDSVASGVIPGTPNLGNWDGLGGSTAPRNIFNAANVGAAYVFTGAGAAWTQQAVLKPTNTDPVLLTTDNFGTSVAIDGNNIVVGSPFEDGSGVGVNPVDNNLAVNSGAAYTYNRAGTAWTPTAYLKQSNTPSQVASWFGWSVDISGTKVIAGAPFEDSFNAMVGVDPIANNIGSADSGAAYTFVASGTTYVPEHLYKACNNNIADYYGHSVAISLDCPVVGAPYEDGSGVLINPADNNANVNAGAVYIPGNCNTPPTVTAVPTTVLQGATLTAAPIGTALDAEDPENIVSVEISKDGGLTWSTFQTLNGVTVTLVDQNGAAAGVNPTAAGAIIANVVASCTATNASFLLRSIDSAGLISLIPAPLVVTVTPNTAPVLTYANVGANLGGVSTVNNPLTASDATPGPAAAGTVYSIMSVGTYTGTAVINPSTGVVTFTGQAPVGTHTIMVKAFDGCLTTTATFTITVKKMEVTISDPIACTGSSNTVSVHAELLNGNATASPFNFVATPTAPLAGVPGTCVSNFGTCVITAASVTVTGILPAGATLTVDYKAIVPNGTAPGTQLCINSVGRLDVNNNGTFDVIDTVMACTTLICPPRVVNPKMSDQKAGSLLVFPYYNSKSADSRDTQIMLSNTGDQEVFVHLFFIDGATCGQADQLTCLTPNASLTIKTSEYDPETTGWLMAVAVDSTGKPVQNNVLIGNAFVKDGAYVDNYGAESFWANSKVLGTMNMTNMTATLFFDGGSYDAMPNQFVAEIQSPLSVAGQRIVTVGMSGDLTQSGLSGAAQVGTGLAFNGEEKAASFASFISGRCQASSIITNTTPRVPGALGGLIPKGSVGTLKFGTGGGVGLIMTPNTNKWSGIRGLHKVGLTATTITIPMMVPPAC